LNGETTLRVRSRYYTSLVSDPCVGYSNGETEDYGIEIFGSPLPVELISFKGLKQKESVLLEWNTAIEINNDHFVVQRSSNGINFSDIGQVEGIGNSTQLNNYEFVDLLPKSGANFYRLKQVDVDGTNEFVGDILRIEFDRDSAFSVFPNPGQAGKTSIVYSGEIDKEVEISVLNMTGKRVYSNQYHFAAQGTQQTLQLSDLVPGIYWILIQNGSRVEKHKYIHL
jgi:hypothetical protein